MDAGDAGEELRIERAAAKRQKQLARRSNTAIVRSSVVPVSRRCPLSLLHCVPVAAADPFVSVPLCSSVVAMASGRCNGHAIPFA